MQLENEKIFLTGGSGYLGKHIIQRLYNTNEITVYSRDEAKHYYLKKQFPKVKFIVGDVRNFDLMNRAAKNHTIGIFAASLKQIEACEENPSEAVKVIINGALNSRLISEDNNFKSACFISTDKSRAATTVYGAMKYVAGESFISNNFSDTKFSTAIYGNVLNSTGSIIPLIWNAIKNNIEIPLYSTEMTRFLLSVDKAIDLIEDALDYDGFNIIPNATSTKILDLFEIYKERFGLKYRIESPRTGEKIHEIMASNEETPRMIYEKEKNIFLMHPKTIYDKSYFSSGEYSSKEVLICKSQLISELEKYEYFK